MCMAGSLENVPIRFPVDVDMHGSGPNGALDQAHERQRACVRPVMMTTICIYAAVRARIDAPCNADAVPHSLSRHTGANIEESKPDVKIKRAHRLTLRLVSPSRFTVVT